MSLFVGFSREGITASWFNTNLKSVHNNSSCFCIVSVTGADFSDIEVRGAMGVAGRVFFILLSIEPGPPISGYAHRGLYGIVTQNLLMREWLTLNSDPAEGTGGLPSAETMFRPPYTPLSSSPNKMPPTLTGRFHVYSNNTTGAYAFLCKAYDDGLDGILTAADAVNARGFERGDTMTPLSPLNTAFLTRSDVGHGPVIPTTPTAVATESFTYYISSTILRGTPLAGDDFAWMQLKWNGSGIALETGFSNAAVKTWVFEKVKSKLNTPADAIYTYKIRSLGSTANPAGYVTCTASGITGDEFELLPHPSIFGSVTCRSVAHGTLFKRYLKAEAVGGVSFPLVTGAPASTSYAFQLRPAALPASLAVRPPLSAPSKVHTTPVSTNGQRRQWSTCGCWLPLLFVLCLLLLLTAYIPLRPRVCQADSLMSSNTRASAESSDVIDEVN